VESIGPFSSACDALDWAVENGTREKVRIDRKSFPCSGRGRTQQ
jgi:hypothetical protein